MHYEGTILCTKKRMWILINGMSAGVDIIAVSEANGLLSVATEPVGGVDGVCGVYYDDSFSV